MGVLVGCYLFYFIFYSNDLRLLPIRLCVLKFLLHKQIYGDEALAEGGMKIRPRLHLVMIIDNACVLSF